MMHILEKIGLAIGMVLSWVLILFALILSLGLFVRLGGS